MSQKNKSELDNLNHSCAHLLAAAVMQLWPDTKRAIGPAIEGGFYYDFDFAEPITEEDLGRIEAKMAEIAAGWNGFEREEVSVEEALEREEDNSYKRELIEEFAEKGEEISYYRSGDFVDLCRGGHVENPSVQLEHFKLLSIAGAYWRGDENRQMLTRIYGTCWPSEAELAAYLERQEEAKRRDHRRIGREMELFSIRDEVGPGLALWLPKGNVIREEIENWAKETERAWGYERVATPHITKANLYYTSGHLPYYKDDMYPPMELDGKEEYYLRPMNCPHHHMVYDAKLRSYRDLPLRFTEYGMCYRYESSGELFGLMRVRGLQINDAHIYCTLDQAVDEFVRVMELHELYYRKLGIDDYYLELALRDPENTEKYHGNEEMWQLAESLMRQAVSRVDIEMAEEEGSAAFYGPKIDFVIRSSIGREFAISTNQIDLYMGKRFGLRYTDNQGNEQTPVIIHRAPLGSHERFIGFLIEHFAGAFPVWLHPVQVKVLPVSDKNAAYVGRVVDQIRDALPALRLELDDSSDTLSNRIRKSQEERVPYMLIIGGREEANDTVNLRLRSEEEIGELTVDEFVARVSEIIQKRSLDLWE